MTNFQMTAMPNKARLVNRWGSLQPLTSSLTQTSTLLPTCAATPAVPALRSFAVMSTLAASFPSLASELSRGLRAAGRAPLADQVEAAAIARVTFDDGADAGYIYVQPARELNGVETNIVGVRHGETLEIETRYWTNIDTDNFGRLAEIGRAHV